jgi:hypothetical protein
MSWTWVALAELAATVLMLVRMVIVGFFQPVGGRVFSWAMFTRGSYITLEFTCYDAEGKLYRIDVLELTQPYNPAVTPRKLERMADFLAQTYDGVSGEGTIMDVAGTRPIRIEAGCVAF